MLGLHHLKQVTTKEAAKWYKSLDENGSLEFRSNLLPSHQNIAIRSPVAKVRGHAHYNEGSPAIFSTSGEM